MTETVAWNLGLLFASNSCISKQLRLGWGDEAPEQHQSLFISRQWRRALWCNETCDCPRPSGEGTPRKLLAIKTERITSMLNPLIYSSNLSSPMVSPWWTRGEIRLADNAGKKKNWCWGLTTVAFMWIWVNTFYLRNLLSDSGEHHGRTVDLRCGSR